MRKLVLLATALPLLSGGCVAQVAWNVATAPVKLAGKAAGGTVDVLTVSPKERDEKWARKHRKAEEKRRKDNREAAKRDRRRGIDRDL